MTVNVEFHFDFGSPNAYLAHRTIPAIESRTGVKFTYIPVLIGGLFKATNNVSPMVALEGILNKAEYMALETQRFQLKHNITDFTKNPFFPINTLQLMRGAIAAQLEGVGVDYINAVFNGMWVDSVNMGDPIQVVRFLKDAPFSSSDILQASADQTVKQQLIDNTSSSVERGNFGSPTFFVENEMYFGKDKLVDVEAEIVRQLGY